MKLTRTLVRSLGWAIAVLFVLDITLALWVGKSKYITMTVTEYLLTVFDSVTAWTGRIVWLIAAIWGIAIALFLGKPPRWLTASQIIPRVAGALPGLFSDPRISVPTLVISIAALPLLVLQLFQEPHILPPAGSVLSTVDVADDRKEIYVAIEDRGQVLVFSADSIQRPGDVINVGNPLIPGRPQRVAIAPRRYPNGEVYIVDAGSDKVLIVDRKTHSVLGSVEVGKAPRWITVTPDERKAYVSNEQPIPQGTISVIDLETRKVVKTITGINCPEGMAMSPNGKRVYVASQCGAGQDPLFIIDTATDRVVDTIRDLAVGISIAITPDGKKLYIVRGEFHRQDEVTGEIVKVPAQLTVIATGQNQVLQHIPVAVNSIAITADSKYVLLGSDRKIDIMDATGDRIVNTISLATSPAGIAITKDHRAYVWLPEESRLFLLGLSGLLSGTKAK